MRDEITDCYATPDPRKVAALLDEEGMDACLDRWGYSQSKDEIYKLAQAGRRLLGLAAERDDADTLVETAQRLGSAYYAAKELGVSEIAVRNAFERRGLKPPKLDPQALRDTLLKKSIARRTVRAAGPKTYAITVRRGQLAWEFI